MLKSSMMAFIIFVWIIGVLLGSTYDGYGMAGSAYAWAGNATAEHAGGYAESPATIIDYVSNFTNSYQRINLVGNIGMTLPVNQEYWGAVFTMATWRFSFIEDYPMVYWIVFLPFTIVAMMSIFVLIYQVLTGNLSWGS